MNDRVIANPFSTQVYIYFNHSTRQALRITVRMNEFLTAHLLREAARTQENLRALAASRKTG
jgi:hypothetical protein